MADKPRRGIVFGIAAAGFIPTAVQVMLLRDLTALASGNELALGLALGSWLAWGAAGSLLASRFRPTPAGLARFLLLGAALAPGTMIAVRSAPLLLGLVPGEVIGFSGLLPLYLLLLGPFCVFNGAVFALACRASGAGRDAGLFYLGEALGAAAGAVLAALLLGKALTPLQLAFGGAGGYCLAAAVVSGSKRFRAATAAAAVIPAAVGISAGAEIDRALVAARWDGYGLVSISGSNYGELVEVEKEGQISLFLNGILAAAWPDRHGAEAAVYPALLAVEKPRRVLLAGGGPGELREILRSPRVQEAVWVEPDPEAARVMAGFPGTGAIFDDPRVRIVHEDLRVYLGRAGGAFDLVLLALPDPVNASVNRFYTLEFYRAIVRRLAPGGICAFSVTSSENYIGPEQARFLAALQRTAEKAFAGVELVPGDPCNFICARGKRAPLDYKLLAARARAEGLHPLAVAEGTLEDRLSPFRTAAFGNALNTAAGAAVNRDLRPICYYYNAVLWSGYFKGGAATWWSRILSAASAIAWWWFLLPAAGIGAVGAAGLGRSRPAARALVAWGACTVGFIGILLQIVLMIGFQVRYGTLYRDLGFLVAGGMFGLGGGGWLGLRLDRPTGDPFRRFLLVLAPAGLFTLASAALLVGFPGLTRWQFYLLAAGAGAVGGLPFPTAVRVLTWTGTAPGAAGGTAYGADLAGAAGGAALVSVVMIPLLGLPLTCLSGALVVLSGCLAVASVRRRG